MDLISDFERGHQKYNHISRERCIAQLKTLRELQARYGDLLDLQGNDLREWVEEKYASGLKASTVLYRLSLVRPFYTWAWERGHINADRLLEIRAVKPPRGAGQSEPKPYTRKEMTRFWQQVDEKYPLPRKTHGYEGDEIMEYYMRRYERGTSSFRKGVRWTVRRSQFLAMASIAVYGGLRMGEIYRLRLEDLDPESEYMVVHGAAKNKAGKSRTRAVPWIPIMRERVAYWLWVRERLDPPHDKVWITAWSTKWDMHPMPWRSFERLMTDLGEGWAWHRLRHTYATEALRAGMPLESVSRILGHSTIGQTMGYAQLVRSDLVDASARVEARLQDALS